MPKQFVVSGSEDRVAAVGKALEAKGAVAITKADLDALAGDAASWAPASLDGYIQLPVNIPADAPTAVERLRQLLAAGLIRRYDAAAAVLPGLKDDAVVLLVAGNHPQQVAGPDDQQARMALLRVLAHAINADRGHGVRTFVVDHRRSAEGIAELAVEGRPDRTKLVADFVEAEPDMRYDDWKLELLRLASFES